MKFYERTDQLQRFNGLVGVPYEYGKQGKIHYFTYAYMRMVQEESGIEMGIHRHQSESQLTWKVLTKYRGDRYENSTTD